MIWEKGLIMHRKEWFILPGLEEVFVRFFSIAKDYLSVQPKINKNPIMIVGDSGVGKSAFIESAEQIFFKKNNLKMNKDGFCDKIKRLNCASFTGELADSEIFGHEKGAFTGAVSDKRGIVEDASGGLLILDEIGELSHEVQAKLLIFIEEGEYRRLGGNQIRRANLKIIGTTNIKHEEFRNDFWFRFYPVFVPALYQRRLDVIYYIFLKYPNIFKRFTSQHALSLMAHNWPGNVREIERIVSSILSEDHLHPWKWIDSVPFVFALDKRQTGLANVHIEELSKRLVDDGFNLVLLNSIISRYGLQIPYSFSSFDELEKIKSNSKVCAGCLDLESCDVEPLFKEESELKSRIDVSVGIVFAPTGKLVNSPKNANKYKKAFKIALRKYSLEHVLCSVKNYLNSKNDFYNSPGFEEVVYTEAVDGLDGVKIVRQDSKVEMVGSCFSAICDLFLRDRCSKENVFDMSDNYIEDYWVNDPCEREVLEDFDRTGLVESTLQFLIGKDVVVSKYDKSDNWGGYVKSIYSANNVNYHNESNGEFCENSFDNKIASFSENKLLMYYYEVLLKRHGKDKDVFRHAGVNSSTCRHKLERLGLLPRKQKK